MFEGKQTNKKNKAEYFIFKNKLQEMETVQRRVVTFFKKNLLPITGEHGPFISILEHLSASQAALLIWGQHKSAP